MSDQEVWRKVESLFGDYQYWQIRQGDKIICDFCLEPEADQILRDHELAQWQREKGHAAWNANANRAEAAEARIAELEAERDRYKEVALNSAREAALSAKPETPATAGEG